MKAQRTSSDLAQLFRHYGSDKDSNGYSPLYQMLFEPYRNSLFTLIEIGIGTLFPGVCSSMHGYAPDTYRSGASLRAWRDYLPKAQIIGVDIQPDTQFEEDRIVTHQCDSTNAGEVKDHISPLQDATPIQFIIDDGSHQACDQIKTLSCFFPYLDVCGFYIIEDIHPGSSLHTQPEMLKEVLGDFPFFFVGLKSPLCVIHKMRLDTQRGHLHY